MDWTTEHLMDPNAFNSLFASEKFLKMFHELNLLPLVLFFVFFIDINLLAKLLNFSLSVPG